MTITKPKHPEWQRGASYKKGDYVTHKGSLWQSRASLENVSVPPEVAHPYWEAVNNPAPAGVEFLPLRARLPEASEARKAVPLVTGLIDYFPDALAAVAFISKLGNDKHNPGEPLHWTRGKSNDHADCIGRHLVDRGTFDKDGIRHSGYLAWRALALLQEELERDNELPISRGST